ncbi:MAG: DUF695 domain-containing protein [Bacteroidota bacterium]
MPQHTDWDFYFCQIHDKPASVMVDLALIHHAPMEDRPELVQVSVHLNQPNPYGLTRTAEAESLYILEDHLAEHLAVNLGGVYVARQTTGGQRVFYYYCRASIDYRNVIAEVMSQFDPYQWSCHAYTDGDWNHFRTHLYPTNYGLQSIMNRRLMDKLRQEGDDLTQAREVEHFVYFPSEKARENFLTEALQQGYAIVELSDPQADAPLPYGAVISRVEKLDREEMDTAVGWLLEAAEQLEGLYDGWGTGVFAS